MKALIMIFLAGALMALTLQACQNPTEKSKGPYQKDSQDTTRKAPADSTPGQHVNPEDTVRKY